MKKFLILCLSIVFAMPLLASGIDANATDASCDNSTLETYSGTANVEINWIPNTIQTRWYNGNTLMDVQTSANTCVYDDALNVPSTPPSRTGYTFTGWTVRPEIDFATTIPTNENGLERWAIGLDNGVEYCWYDTNTGSAHQVACDDDSTYKELQLHEYKVKFENWFLYGMSSCSTTAGVWKQIGTPTIADGQYCWCKVTGYRMNNVSVINRPNSNLSWVFASNRNSAENCIKSCAANCANNVVRTSEFRTALFTPASNN